MAEQVIEATWDELVRRQDLRGRLLRVVVIDEPVEPGPANGRADWATRLRQWSDGHPAVARVVDDSRDGIYGGTLDDPR